MSEGLEKAREISNKLKAEQKELDNIKEQDRAIAINQLDLIRKNTDLAKMYTESAKVGADNLSGELPYLKVHQVGKSTTNELSDGTEPHDGWFFYKVTGEEFATVKCHILYISKGFRSPGLESGDKLIFNQVLAGLIIDGEELKPFMMFMSGKKLNPMWEFGKAANRYTHAKPIPIPMFALTVNLTTVREVNSFGKSWLVNFEIEKTSDGTPVLVVDPGEFQFLKDSTEAVKDTIASLIAAKTKGVDLGDSARPLQEVETARDEDHSEDIPF